MGMFKSKKNDDWLDWLADEPVPASIRDRMRQKAVREASAPAVRRVRERVATPQQPIKQQSQAKDATVSIHISLPKLKRPHVPAKLKTKKIAVAGTGVMTVLVIGVVGLKVYQHTKGAKGSTGVLGTSSQAEQRPNFDYLLPAGKASTTTGNTGAYNTQSKTVSFPDSIGGVKIVIHQTPLNDTLKQDTDNKVKEIADNNAFTKKITTSNPTAYLGTSAKGQQTVVFAKKGLLVFIQADSAIDEHDWAEYITNLQ